MEGFEMTTGRSVTAEMVTSRQTQEVQGQIIMAKKFPRDEVAASRRIMTACQRKKLAESAEYEYTRGTSKVVGPSIRLAEALAQNWGNIDFGFVELERKAGESIVMAQAWDLETNTRQTRTFAVKHVRELKEGRTKPLTSDRDINEMVSNQASRRVRACILGIIPGDIVEEAIEQCHKTLLGKDDTPLIDRIKKCVQIAEKEYQIPQESLEKYIGCKAEAFSMNDLIRLNRVFNSIKDGMAKREEVFELPGVEKKEAEDAFAGKDKKEEKSADGQQELNLEGGADAETK